MIGRCLPERRPRKEAVLDADLDTLLIALYVELDDRIIPASRRGRPRRGPGRRDENP